MHRFRFVAILLVFGFAAYGCDCNSGYISGPEGDAAQSEAPTDSVQPATPTEDE